MAWTATSLSNAIQAYTQNFETSFVANIPIMVQQCEDRISKAVVLPMNRKDASITLTNGTPTAPLPDDFLAPFSFMIDSSVGFTPVEFVDVSYMREVFPNPLQVGVPRWYSLFDSANLVMAPTPTVGILGWLNYFYKPASIIDAGTSWLGDNAENALLYGSLVEAYTYMKGEQDLMQTYETKFQTALSNLKVLGEAMDLGDAWRMGERRVKNATPLQQQS